MDRRFGVNRYQYTELSNKFSEVTAEEIKYNTRNICTEIKTESFHNQRQMFTSSSISQKQYINDHSLVHIINIR